MSLDIITKNIEHGTDFFYLFIFAFFSIGAALGSFLSVYIYRFPIMETFNNLLMIKDNFKKEYEQNKDLVDFYEKHKNFNLSYPSSFCDNCGVKIKFYHNIPIFSYIFLKGKCGNCKKEFSMKLFFTEIFFAFSATSLFIHTQNVFETLTFLTIISSLYTISSIDLKHKIAPYTLIFTTFVGMIMLSKTTYSNIELSKGIEYGVGTILTIYILHYVMKLLKGIKNNEENLIGDIDIYLIGILSVSLPNIISIIYMLIFMSLISLFFSIFDLFRDKKSDTNEIPLTPFISISYLFINLFNYIVY